MWSFSCELFFNFTSNQLSHRKQSRTNKILCYHHPPPSVLLVTTSGCCRSSSAEPYQRALDHGQVFQAHLTVHTNMKTYNCARIWVFFSTTTFLYIYDEHTSTTTTTITVVTYLLLTRNKLTRTCKGASALFTRVHKEREREERVRERRRSPALCFSFYHRFFHIFAIKLT